jgi:hypothetical protein
MNETEHTPYESIPYPWLKKIRNTVWNYCVQKWSPDLGVIKIRSTLYVFFRVSLG